MKTNQDTRWIGKSQQRITYKKNPRCCNLCEEEFTPHSIFDRYCSTCKNKSELLKYSEWLPELDHSIQGTLSA